MGLSGEQENTCLKENDLVLNKQQEEKANKVTGTRNLTGTQESGTK